MVKNQSREPAPDNVLPSLARRPALGRTKAVVLVLHGGKAVSRERAMTTQLSALRMLPFAWAVRRRTWRQGTAVWRLRYRYRGWNGSEASPVADARWALEQVRARHGDVPVVLLGHSMGGRTAAHVADDPSVTGLVLLAPWLQPGEPVPGPGKDVVVLHGDQDRITSAGSSVAWAREAERRGAHVTVRVLNGAEHFMLRQASTWHRLAAQAVRAQLDARLSASRASAASLVTSSPAGSSRVTRSTPSPAHTGGGSEPSATPAR